MTGWIEAMIRPSGTQGLSGRSYWVARKGATGAMISLIGIGIVLALIGFVNEARIRPYQYYYNCEEYTDIDGFTRTACECEPPEYEAFIALAFFGVVSLAIGAILLANLLYNWRRSGGYVVDDDTS